jgi:triosephosphate isomerase
MTRRTLIAGNWKMHTSAAEAVALAQSIAASIDDADCEVAVFPPFPWLVAVRDAVHGSAVRVGAQNCHWEAHGAYTGEVSAGMLAECCSLVLAGHSERRHLFGETDDQVGRKVAAIQRAGLQAVLCVGETLTERQAGNAEAVVTRQLGAGLAAASTSDIERLIIAYEPVWAIGTGVAATATDAQDMCHMIRDWLVEHVGDDGSGIRILYGGSVSPANAAELLAQPDVDGGLVGGASLKAESFLGIIAAAGERT